MHYQERKKEGKRYENRISKQKSWSKDKTQERVNYEDTKAEVNSEVNEK